MISSFGRTARASRMLYATGIGFNYERVKEAVAIHEETLTYGKSIQSGA